jgi:hypothetical protein
MIKALKGAPTGFGEGQNALVAGKIARRRSEGACGLM